MTYAGMAGLYACHAGQDQHACAAAISVISAARWPTRFPDRCGRPESRRGGGFAAAHFRASRAGYGAAPPAPRVLRIALARDSPPGCPLTPETTAAPGARNSGQAPGLPPRRARHANPPVVAGARKALEPGGDR
jgi:hypothetical protein